MNNLYAGATRTISGASYLDSRAILHVTEGYEVGDSFQSTYIGEYEISDLSNNGNFNQTLQISAVNKRERLRYNSDLLDRELRSDKPFYDEFNDQNIFDGHWGQFGENLYGVSGSMLGATMNWDISLNTPNKAFAYLTEGDYDNFVTDLHFNASNIGGVSNNQDVRIAFRVRGEPKIEEGNNTNIYFGYRIRLRGPSTQAVDLLRIDDSIGTTLGTANFNFVNNTDYWVRVFAHNDHMGVYISNTRYGNFTELFRVRDNTYSKGWFGILDTIHNGPNTPPSSNTRSSRHDFFSINPIKRQLTYKDVLTNVAHIGDITNIYFSSSRFSGISGFFASPGTSWMVGNSNNEIVNVGASRLNLSSDASDTYYMTNGNSFQDFVFECEIKGVSFAPGTSSPSGIGMFVGTTNSFYAMGLVFGATVNNSRSLVVNRIGASNYNYTYASPYLAPVSDKWYNFKMIKSNLYLSWYLEDTLCGFIYGTSFTSINGDDNNIGFYVSGASNIGRFRNINLYDFTQLADTTLIPGNQPVNQVFDRFLFEGSNAVMTGATLEFLLTGNSRGMVNINGDSQYIISDSSNIRNQAEHLMVNFGIDSITSKVNPNDRTLRQLDSSRVDFLQDTNITNRTDGENILDNEFMELNREAENYTLVHSNIPYVQLYDRVKLVDKTLGVSQELFIYNFVKSYESSGGRFRINLDLAP